MNLNLEKKSGEITVEIQLRPYSMMATQPIFTELTPPIFPKYKPANWYYLYIFYIKFYPRGLRNLRNNCKLSVTSVCTVWPLLHRFVWEHRLLNDIKCVSGLVKK